ncbi:ABC transporter permease [Brevibacterium ammoniilyticum]|uniref:ABC transporter permease n=2 Tax=Brevibacteriaceae TaxID=85019 RepID=A0ABP9U284_9MICO
MISGFLASIVEAWQELRVHKVRVLMSLIGVGVAVCGLTLVVGFGDMMQKGLADTFEKQNGRAATYTLYVMPPSGDPNPNEAEKIARALDETKKRFGIEYVSAVANGEMEVPSPSGNVSAFVSVVDPDYNVMHRVKVDHGRWFNEFDATNLSPPIVADEKFLEQYGIDPSSLPRTVDLPGHQAGKATVIGSFAGAGPTSDIGNVYLLNGHQSKFMPDATVPTEFEMWLPPETAKELSKQVRTDLKRQLPGFDISADRTDYGNEVDGPLGAVQNVLLFISVLILLMGMLGLVNISMVTIQQRVREIGIRRSFGATSRRIFFSVMMESVVATTMAGAIGVLIAILVLKAPIVGDALMMGTGSTPQIPVTAVIVGMLVSIGIGALAGLVPALVAMRVRIIDAIRA